MIRFILPGIFWTFTIIILSLTSSSEFDLNEFEFNGIDKIVHFTMYAVFGVLWTTAFKRQNIYLFLRRKAFLLSFSGGFTLGFILEILQEVLTASRSFDALDLIANSLGCAFGIIIFIVFYKGHYK